MPLSLFVFLTQAEVEFLPFELQQNKPMMLHPISFTLYFQKLIKATAVY